MKLKDIIPIMLAFLLATMVFVPMVSAAEDQGISADSGATAMVSPNGDMNTTSTAREGITPYVNIYAYGPSSAAVNQQVTISTSGEIGNIVNQYFQKFYIQNLNTGGSLDGVQYTSVPSGWTNAMGTYSKSGYVIWHDTFTSSWGVRFTQPGTYEVVASAVGVGTIPTGQSRFTITVT
ncbi:MAG: hypothetical protein M0Q92_02425 [Methanoregula sp.]|jgi:hypothetical protein|nr:hypothetical protein [Methanoregula sp.]